MSALWYNHFRSQSAWRAGFGVTLVAKARAGASESTLMIQYSCQLRENARAAI